MVLSCFSLKVGSREEFLTGSTVFQKAAPYLSFHKQFSWTETLLGKWSSLIARKCQEARIINFPELLVKCLSFGSYWQNLRGLDNF